MEPVTSCCEADEVRFDENGLLTSNRPESEHPAAAMAMSENAATRGRAREQINTRGRDMELLTHTQQPYDLNKHRPSK
jgi:hypothetical protein